MKNTLFLIFLAGIISFSSIAQERFPSLLFNNTSAHKSTHQISGHNVDRRRLKDLDLRKTSSSTGSWYDYPDSVLGTTSTGLSTLFMWPDTAAIFGYTDGLGNQVYTGYDFPDSLSPYYNISIGSLFDPMDSVWVPYGTFIPPSSGYTIDSVMIVGTYGRPVGASYTDSLKLTFVYGNGDTTTNVWLGYILPIPYYLDGFWPSSTLPDTAVYFPVMFWDSVHNTATNAPGVSVDPITYSFPLGPADTAVASLFVRSYAVNITVPDSNFAAMSVSFISGATTFPVFPATDTVQYADGSFKYGDFQPLFASWQDTGYWPYPPLLGGPPDSSMHITANLATGFFKYGGNNFYDSVMKPYYSSSWTIPGDYGYPSNPQYPYILFHAYSSLVTKVSAVNNPVCQVKAYPNPAHDEVTIAFYLSAPASVSVSLTNVLGQEVSEQQMGVVTTGNAVMNISALPAGMYFYTVTANGQRNTGKVLVAH